jgi:hypothetical protein
LRIKAGNVKILDARTFKDLVAPHSGLGGSTDPSSPMCETLDSGVADGTVTTQDLNSNCETVHSAGAGRSVSY